MDFNLADLAYYESAVLPYYCVYYIPQQYDFQVHRQLLASLAQPTTTSETKADPMISQQGNMELKELAGHMNRRHRAAQDAQRASLELFQSLYFREQADKDDTCVADAIVLQLRSNGMIVYVPR